MMSLNGPFVVVGIDQSISGTGIWILREEGEGNGSIIKTKDMSGMNRMNHIIDTIQKIVDTSGATLVCMEDVTRMAASASLNVLTELAGCIKLSVCRSGKPVLVQNQSVMKKFNLGAGDTSKDSSYLLKVFEKTNISFKDDNIADAYMHANLGMSTLMTMRGLLRLADLKPYQRECFESIACKESGFSQGKFKKLTDDQKLEYFKSGILGRMLSIS